MGFDDAQTFTMPLGKYKGQQLWEISEYDEGFKYLDWLVGQSWVYGDLKAALERFLKDPCIARDLAALLERDE